MNDGFFAFFVQIMRRNLQISILFRIFVLDFQEKKDTRLYSY